MGVLASEGGEEQGEGFGPMEEGVAMIGEGEGNDAASGEPTGDAAEDEAVEEFLAWGRRGEDGGLVAVRAAEGLEPGGGMENGGERVGVEEGGPAGVEEGVESVHRLDHLGRVRAVHHEHTTAAAGVDADCSAGPIP